MVNLAEEKLLTIKEAAALLRCTTFTLRRWMKLGVENVRLVPERIGNRYFYTQSLIAEWQRQVDIRRGKSPGQKRTPTGKKKARV